MKWMVGIVGTAVVGLAVCAFACRSLFYPPSADLQESYAAEGGDVGFDHGAFDSLLRAHVSDAGFVDYAALREQLPRLEGYLQRLAAADFGELGRDAKLAFLINAYNACTLRLIAERYPIDTIKSIPDAERWDAARWNLLGRTLSLNQIEHEEVRGNFREPRIHFALVCAAVGCPPLRNEAYAADRLEAQLAAQAEHVHETGRWFAFDAASATVSLTKLYDWYAGDFEQVAGSAVEYAARYSPDLQKALDAGVSPRVVWLDYDWSLNGIENAK